jgi:hypothetical protein
VKAKVCPKGGKRGYPTKEAARRANHSNGARLRAYLCPACHMYHVTRRKKREA